jgi:hypothetical protein
MSPPLQTEIELASRIFPDFSADRFIFEADKARQAEKVLGFRLAEDYKFPDGANYMQFERNFINNFGHLAYIKPKHFISMRPQLQKLYDDIRELNPTQFEKITDPTKFDISELEMAARFYDIILGCSSLIPAEDIEHFVNSDYVERGEFPCQEWVVSQKRADEILEKIRPFGVLHDCWFSGDKAAVPEKNDRYDWCRKENRKLVRAEQFRNAIKRFKDTVKKTFCRHIPDDLVR